MKFLRELYNRYLNWLVDFNSWKYRVWISIRYPHVKWGRNIKVYGKLQLSFSKASEIEIGDNVIFRSHSQYNYVGIYKPVSIFVGESAYLKIGDNCGFSGTSIVAQVGVKIGKYCNFGGNSSVWDTDFHSIYHEERRLGTKGRKSKPIYIGDDVFIGANAILLKGTEIGDRSVIGAGTVISKCVGHDEVWGGNPGRFIKSLKL